MSAVTVESSASLTRLENIQQHLDASSALLIESMFISRVQIVGEFSLRVKLLMSSRQVL